MAVKANAPLTGTEDQHRPLGEITESQELQRAESEEYSLRQGMLQDAVQILNERERHILTERRLQEDPTTLEDLSKVYGISRERVRQIEREALNRLRENSTIRSDFIPN